MNTLSQNLLRALHEGKWLSIVYQNKQEEVTRYWIAVREIHVAQRSLQIEAHPEQYESLFGDTANLKVLNYLADCSRLDCQPYQCDYGLIHGLDGECLASGEYPLREEQYVLAYRRLLLDVKKRTLRPVEQITIRLYGSVCR